MSYFKLSQSQKMAIASLVVVIFTVVIVSWQLVGNDRGTVEEYSRRWKAHKRVEDFVWLKDHALPIGASQGNVRRIFGEPLSIAKREDGSEFWPYVKIDVPRKQYHTWAIVFDIKQKVSGTHTKAMA